VDLCAWARSGEEKEEAKKVVEWIHDVESA